MKQKFLDQAQRRLDQLKDLEQQVEDTKKQIKDKESEISDFEQEWVNNCKHVFYRIQQISCGRAYTTGYYCCLCSKYERLQLPQSNNTQSELARCRRVSKPWTVKHYARPKPYFPPPPEETHEFIGTIVNSIYADGKKSNKERFPIPPEYQAEVESKEAQLAKLNAELAGLVKKLKKLEKSVENFKDDLSHTAHLLNQYFGYPKIIERPPFRWSRDDFNYDPFD